MADCPNLPGCPFFNGKMADTSGMGLIYRKKYCLGDHLSCARFAVCSRLGKPAVPADLYPNMRSRADAILAAQGIHVVHPPHA